MCCTAREGGRAQWNFAAHSLHWEHVRLSAHRSRWPICPSLPVAFSHPHTYTTYLSPPATTSPHSLFCPSGLPLCRVPTSHSLLISSHYMWRFLVTRPPLHLLLPPHLSKGSLHPSCWDFSLQSPADSLAFTLCCQEMSWPMRLTDTCFCHNYQLICSSISANTSLWNAPPTRLSWSLIVQGHIFNFFCLPSHQTDFYYCILAFKKILGSLFSDNQTTNCCISAAEMHSTTNQGRSDYLDRPLGALINVNQQNNMT